MDTPSRRFRSGALERDFYVLFGEKARWKSPFGGEGIIGTIVSVGITTLLVRIFIGIFFHIEFSRNAFGLLAVAIFIWEHLRYNWTFLRDLSLRRRLQRKYFPIVQHTEAFELLEEAVAVRKRGTVDVLGLKEETEAELMRLWKAAFAEADSLQAVQSPLAVVSDPLDVAPVGDQIHRYFSERAASYREVAN